jgi:hypothetical protein
MYTQLTVPYLVPSLLWTRPYIWISRWQSRCDTMFQNYLVPHTFVFTINLVYFYLTLSACKYFQVHVDWQVTHEFMIHSSESPIGWNMHRSRYAFFIKNACRCGCGSPTSALVLSLSCHVFKLIPYIVENKICKATDIFDKINHLKHQG